MAKQNSAATPVACCGGIAPENISYQPRPEASIFNATFFA
jgi:hypothetical protein